MPTNTIQRISFGDTGLDVTPLGFGGAPIGFLHKDQADVAEVLTTLLDAGVNVIDTAACYPGSEEAIGKAVADRRDEYVLISKCGHKVDDESRESFSKPLILDSIDRSLRRLKTDAIDVMLIHTCKLEQLKQGDAIEAVVEAKRAGKVRLIGYSGDNDAAEWAAGRDEFDAIETSINIADQVNIDKMLPICRRTGKGVIVKRPIANACWKKPDEQEGVYRDYASEYARRFAAIGLKARDLGFEEGDWPEIALRFTLAQEGAHTMIVGTTNTDHLRTNLAAAAKGPLPDEAVRRIRESFAQARNDDAEGDWSGQG